MKNKYLYFIFLKVVLLLLACLDPQFSLPKPNAKNDFKDRWLILGKVQNEDFKGKEVQAIGLDGTKYTTKVNENLVFGLELPGLSSYSLYFLPSREALVFEDGNNSNNQILRLPFCYNNSFLDLGNVNIIENKAFVSNNPSQQLDFDHDGMVDYEDADDLNTGMLDRYETDFRVITVCHENINLPIELPSLEDHLQHGDFVGKCHQKDKEDLSHE